MDMSFWRIVWFVYRYRFAAGDQICVILICHIAFEEHNRILNSVVASIYFFPQKMDILLLFMACHHCCAVFLT